MSPHDFLFALDLSDEPHYHRMLQDLSAIVFKYVGYDAGRADALVADLRTALSACGPAHCDVRFEARDGALRISVTSAGGRAWETTHTLPSET